MYIFIGMMVVLLIIMIGIGNFFYNIALNVKTSKSFIFKHTDQNCKEERDKRKQKEEDKEWLEENAKEVYIQATKNNLRLHGYCIENQKQSSKRWAILIHGYTADAVEMTYAARAFLTMGYHILMVDLRGHGKSEGKYIAMGWHDRLDIIDWINYLIKKDKEVQIVLYGVSMGAATVMMTIGEKLSKNVKLAIEDCGYTSIWEEFSWELKTLFHLPPFPILYMADLVTRIRAGYSLKQGNCIKQLEKANIPVLFIHGDQDKFVPFYMQEKLVNTANKPREQLIIKGAAHAECAKVNPELYWKTIEKFVIKNT